MLFSKEIGSKSLREKLRQLQHSIGALRKGPLCHGPQSLDFCAPRRLGLEIGIRLSENAHDVVDCGEGRRRDGKL